MKIKLFEEYYNNINKTINGEEEGEWIYYKSNGIDIRSRGFYKNGKKRRRVDILS